MKEIMSRPTRARGLKRYTAISGRSKKPVAPHAGAWIETVCCPSYKRPIVVAPHAGAWIETLQA